MKKMIAFILALVMVCGLVACGAKTEAPATEAAAAPAAEAPAAEAPAAEAPAAEAPAEKFVVGVCQLVPHVALDAATEGFVTELKNILGEENVEVIVQNAAGDSAACSSIANDFVSQGVDLIMANATPALQAAAAATADIPILGTSVTEYGVAMGKIGRAHV